MSVFSPYSGSDVAPLGLDIFNIPANQVAILKQCYEDIRPISQYNGLNPLSFEVWGWSGGAKVLGELPVPGRPT